MSGIGPPVSFDAGTAPASASHDQALGPLLRATLRHWIVVFVVTGLSAGIALSTVLQSEPAYETSASVIVKPLPQQNAAFIGIGAVVESVDPTRTVQTAAALIRTPSAADAAAKTMGPGWTRERVEDSVRIAPRGESYVLAITAKGPTATSAARLANAYANAALDARGRIVQANITSHIRALRRRLIRLQRASGDGGQLGDLNTRFEQLRALQVLGTDPSLQLSQRAQLPGGPTGPPQAIVVMLAVAGGLILGCMAALALEFFTRRVRDEAEIARLFPVPILIGIPRFRAGRRGRRIHPQDIPPDAFEQIRLLRVQLPLGEIPTSLLVTSANSGDGKTTVASALAAAIALGDQDVILMDLDLRQPDAKSAFDVPRPAFAFPGANDEVRLEHRLEPVPGMPRLRTMPAPKGDALAQERFIRQLPDLLAQAKRLVSCVIVDSAPIGEVSDALRVASACDHAVFVVRPRHTERSRLILTRDILLRAGITPLGIVIVGQKISGLTQRYYGYHQPVADVRAEGPTRSDARPLPAVPSAPLDE